MIMGNLAAAPNTMKHCVLSTYWHTIAASVMLQGRRVSEEDAILLLTDIPNHPNVKICGVFDGHSGAICSQLVARLLPQYLGECEMLDDASIIEKCISLDEDLMNVHAVSDGSTATFCLIEYNEDRNNYSLTVCNIGDSRILIYEAREKCARTLTRDHHPCEKDEMERIEKAGGTVMLKRVNGSLAVSRAFGDFTFKSNPSDPYNNLVSCVPEITRLTAEPGDILYLACDGVYENLTDIDLGILLNLMSENKLTPMEMAVSLVDYALISDSADNICNSVLVFQDPHKNTRVDQKLFKEFYIPPIKLQDTAERPVSHYEEFLMYFTPYETLIDEKMKRITSKIVETDNRDKFREGLNETRNNFTEHQWILNSDNKVFKDELVRTSINSTEDLLFPKSNDLKSNICQAVNQALSNNECIYENNCVVNKKKNIDLNTAVKKFNSDCLKNIVDRNVRACELNYVHCPSETNIADAVQIINSVAPVVMLLKNPLIITTFQNHKGFLYDDTTNSYTIPCNYMYTSIIDMGIGENAASHIEHLMSIRTIKLTNATSENQQHGQNGFSDTTDPSDDFYDICEGDELEEWISSTTPLSQ